MSQLITSPEPQINGLFTVDLRSIRVTPAQFELLCRDNPDLRMELTAKGKLIVMAPAGSKTAMRNSILTAKMAQWTQADRTGVAFDSSAGFTLPNGAIRSPDASWVKRERWEALTEEEQEGFAPLCPDFVIELRSRSDNLPRLEKKMLEYIMNGALMAWLIDPLKKRVYIYRPEVDTEVVEDPEVVQGDPELPGFVLNVRELW